MVPNRPGLTGKRACNWVLHLLIVRCTGILKYHHQMGTNSRARRRLMDVGDRVERFTYLFLLRLIRDRKARAALPRPRPTAREASPALRATFFPPRFIPDAAARFARFNVRLAERFPFLIRRATDRFFLATLRDAVFLVRFRRFEAAFFAFLSDRFVAARARLTRFDTAFLARLTFFAVRLFTVRFPRLVRLVAVLRPLRPVGRVVLACRIRCPDS